MIDRRTLSSMLMAGVATSLFQRASKVQAQPAAPVRNVVLVHGAYADGSCWSEVIGPLQVAGLNVTAVQNPLTSLADDVAATRRILALQDGPTVLVGHSWAGTVISEAGVDPQVSALVYIAARAPDVGEDYGALAGKFPTPPIRAWKLKSCWYAVSKQDRATSPELERFFAKRMRAKTIEVEGGHLSMVTHPQEITGLILQAADRSS